MKDDKSDHQHFRSWWWEWVNLIQMTIVSTIVGKNPLEEMAQPSLVNKGPKCNTWVQFEKQ